MKSPFNNSSLSADLSDTETQPPDDECWPPASPGGEFENESGDEDELQYIQDTEPVDDVYAYGEAFETQVVAPDDEILVMDCGNETQVVNLAGETQVVNLAGETQVVDELYCVENVCTQVLDENNVEVASDSDGDGTDETEALCDTQEVSDDDSVTRSASHSINQEKSPKMGSCKREDAISKAQFDASSDREHRSGSVHRGFLSIRTASIRAGGLAAREMALKRGNGKSCSPKSDSSSMKIHATEHTATDDVRDFPNPGKQINQEFRQETDDEQMKEIRSGSRFSVCSSAVRKLFAEDTVAETKQSDSDVNNFNDAADLPQLFGFENGLAGLSYINSQEPGESSQANALDFVDKFLKVNVIESDQDVDIRSSTGGKAKALSSAKGTQSLAKIAILGSADGENGIFDWDDCREDEGGGEFFQKKKDLFFVDGLQKQKSFTQPRKPRCLDSKGKKAVEKCRDEEEEHSNTKKKLKDLVHSDSRVILHKTRGSSKLTKLRENFVKKLDEQFNAVSDDGLLDTDIGKNEPDMVDVGPDTQMAAEAMETLCIGLVVPEKECGNGGKGSDKLKKASRQVEARSRVQNKERLSPKKARSSNAGVVTRKSKRKRSCAEVSEEASHSSIRSNNVRKQGDSEPVKAQQKRPRLVAEKYCAENVRGNVDNVCSKIREVRKLRRSSKASDLDETNRCHVTAFTKSREKMKCGLLEQLGSFTPVASRTRRLREVNQISAGKESNDSRELKNLAGGSTRRKRSKIDANASEAFLAKEKTDNAVELRDAKSVCNELSSPKFSGTSGALKIDAADYPKGRRTSRKFPLNTQEAKARYNTRSSMVRTDANSTSTDINNVVNAKASINSNKKSDVEVEISAKGAEATVRVDSSPRDGSKPSASASTTPVNCRTPINAASPICMGDEYHKQSCRRRLSRPSLFEEVCSLTMDGVKPILTDSRRRRDMSDVRVLFSHHLDAVIIKQQKKILTRLGASEVSSMSGATHFITDKFVRTRNMLEAIALGKPVVTHLWLDSCGQASCLIDEKNFILRDSRKEKEFGFSMPVSLARACQHPLLQGQRVLITPNTKPGKEILASLVKAVCGLAVERLGRSALKDEKLLDDLLVLSCEEDYETCMPFLERGAAVYSSELLLNGIVIQKLEYERHRLFSEHVKRTRSTIWVKKDNKQYLPVTQRK